MTTIGSLENAGAPDINIACHLGRVADRRPEAVALKIPRRRTRAGEIDYLSLTFRELDREVASA